MTREVVVDSCVAVKWFVVEPDADKAVRLLDSDTSLFAPDFVLLEVANALWKNQRLGRLTSDHADRCLAEAPRYFDQLLPTPEFLEEALTLARAIDHPVYDCLYVVASRRRDAPLVTSDDTLVRKLAGVADAKRIVPLSTY